MLDLHCFLIEFLINSGVVVKNSCAYEPIHIQRAQIISCTQLNHNQYTEPQFATVWYRRVCLCTPYTGYVAAYFEFSEQHKAYGNNISYEAEELTTEQLKETDEHFYSSTVLCVLAYLAVCARPFPCVRVCIWNIIRINSINDNNNTIIIIL